MSPTRNRLRTTLLTALALLAFAANSVLCRLALDPRAIDPVSFTTLRMLSGAGALALIIALRRRQSSGNANWLSAIILLAYALPFSLAYTRLGTGTGALVLFGSVQATMIVAALRSGERPHPLEWLGLAAALAGLIYLISPGLTAPSASGSALMAVAGVCWGLYSLRGRGSSDPLGDTASNFVRTLPFLLVVSLALRSNIELSARGALLAAASGALASGIGYVIWYTALAGLTTTRAATVQLSVPVLAALGGVIFLSESISLRLLVSTVVILGGVALAVLGRGSAVRRASTGAGAWAGDNLPR